MLRRGSIIRQSRFEKRCNPCAGRFEGPTTTEGCRLNRPLLNFQSLVKVGLRHTDFPIQIGGMQYKRIWGGNPGYGPALYDLEKDYAELHNVIAHYPHVVAKMKQIMTDAFEVNITWACEILYCLVE